MFADLPKVEAPDASTPLSLPAAIPAPTTNNRAGQQPVAQANSGGTSDRPTVFSENPSILWRLLSGQPVSSAGPAKSQADSSTTTATADEAGWFQRFAATWSYDQSESKQPTTDPFGPPNAQFGSHAPDANTSAASKDKPTRLPAVFTPDQNVSGLWKQLSVKGGTPAAGTQANPPQPNRGAAPPVARQPVGPNATEAVTNRMTGLIHQFVASNDEVSQGINSTAAQSQSAAGTAATSTAATAGNPQDENPWAQLWRPMTNTQDGLPASEVSLAQSESKSSKASAAENDEIPTLLMPFYFTNSDGLPKSQVASSRGTAGGSSLIPSHMLDGSGTLPVAFLQDADGEPLPQPTKSDDDRLQPEDLGIPGEEPRPAASAGAAGTNADGEEPKNLVTADKLGEEPPDNSLQFLRFTGILLKPGQTQYDIGLTYTFSENQFPILITDGMGGIIGVDEVNFRLRELSMPFEMRCGLTKRVQMFAGSSLGWSNVELTVDDLEAFDNDGGLGDIYGGVTIQFREQTECSPHVIGTFGFTAPTGGDPFSSASGFAPSGPALGGGFWNVFGNMLWVRTYDPVTTFYGVGVRHSFEHEYIGLDLRPGNEYNYTCGVGFAVNEKMTLSTRFRGAWIDNLDVNGQRIIGSTLEPMSIRMAATIAQKKKIVEPFVEFGITDDATSSYFGVICTY
jgi:hypothetical protein